MIKNIRGSRKRVPQGTRDPWEPARARYTVRARAGASGVLHSCIAEPRAAPIFYLYNYCKYPYTDRKDRKTDASVPAL